MAQTLVNYNPHPVAVKIVKVVDGKQVIDYVHAMPSSTLQIPDDHEVHGNWLVEQKMVSISQPEAQPPVAETEAKGE